MGYIAVIGAGSWGTTLACILSEKGFDISLWVYEESLAEEIRNTRINGIYLPDIAIPDNIRITHKLNEAVKQARYVVSAIPTQYTRAVFEKADFYIPDEAVIISASKGIERGTLLTVSSIFKEITAHKIAVISGPSFAKEAIMKKPTAVTLATENADFSLQLQKIFNTHYFCSDFESEFLVRQTAFFKYFYKWFWPARRHK